jgi:hypothetical protein
MLLAIRAHATVSFDYLVSLLTKTSKPPHIKKDIIMNKPSDLNEIQILATSLCNLIDALIQLFPEGVGEEFDGDVLLTLLAKAKEDAKTLQAVASALLR